MSEKSQLSLSSYIEVPEADESGSMEEYDKRVKKAIIDSSTIEIIDEIGKLNFKYSWLTLSLDIKDAPIKEQINVAEKILDKIGEVYDFNFPEKISLYTQNDLNSFYKFIEFLEYDNIYFLVNVWKYLGPKNLLKIDIKNYCNNHIMKIIKEIENQSDTYVESKLITVFLRCYYKEKMIEWFVKHSKRLKVDITVLIN